MNDKELAARAAYEEWMLAHEAHLDAKSAARAAAIQRGLTGDALIHAMDTDPVVDAARRRLRLASAELSHADHAAHEAQKSGRP